MYFGYWAVLVKIVLITIDRKGLEIFFMHEACFFYDGFS